MKSIVLVALLLTGCSTMQPNRGGEVDHVVVVWLKNPGNKDERARMIAESQKLRDIPGVQRLEVGEVIPSSRLAVDSSFDVALTIRFNSLESLAAYDTHPIHVKAVKEVLMPLAAKVAIYDFVVNKGD